MASDQSWTVAAFIERLERHYPTALAESWDNVGLLAGRTDRPLKGVLLTLDLTEAVLEEAIERGCNLIVAHHPVLFRPISSMTTRHWTGRVLTRALEAGVALYAAHTNLDNSHPGVNTWLADRLGLKGAGRPIIPGPVPMLELRVFVPPTHAAALREALARAGAGRLGAYEACSFSSEGTGRYRPLEGAHPYKGVAGKLEEAAEECVSVVFGAHDRGAVLGAMRAAHPYEEVAHYLTTLDQPWAGTGGGLLIDLKQSLTGPELLARLHSTLGTPIVKHTPFLEGDIRKIALCGGAGASFIEPAVRAGAGALITGDLKHHEWLEADGRLLLVDIGHYESERHVPEGLSDQITGWGVNFAVHIATRGVNPVCYSLSHG